jgi:alkylhydroperoxidase family enzyme
MWARILAEPLPLTAARMLELDCLHRSGDQLEPKLRGLVRWAAADANGCDYAKTVAVADLRRAGVTAADLHRLLADPSRLSPVERAAVAFARKLMREAHAVTDEEMKHLLEFLGEERVVALVSLLAHASFQDRILLATNVQAEPDDPLPPLGMQLAKPQPKPLASDEPPSAKGIEPTLSTNGDDTSAEWFGLQDSLNRQRTRLGRIRVPSKEEVRKRLGEGHPGLWQADIYWSRVCFGNQPELTAAWFACVASFRQEAGLDRLFEQSLFWLVTRSLQCYY